MSKKEREIKQRNQRGMIKMDAFGTNTKSIGVYGDDRLKHILIQGGGYGLGHSAGSGYGDGTGGGIGVADAEGGSYSFGVKEGAGAGDGCGHGIGLGSGCALGVNGVGFG